MNLINLDGVGKIVGSGPLFQDVSCGIDEGERIGFVGPNGCGKSTFLDMLTGRTEADQGALARKRNLRINTLDQTPIWEDGDSLRDFLYRSEDPLLRLVDAYERALEQAHQGVAAERELALLSERMELECGFELEHRFASILSELGISDLQTPMSSLSGGMVKKAALARVLAPDADLLLLDEPTNHLDIQTIEWLEQKLCASGRALVLVTHDRWFLDAVCTHVLEIDRGSIRKYEGSYSDYLEKLEARDIEDQGRERKRQSILRVELEWLMRGPKARACKDKKRSERVHELLQRRGIAEDSRAGFNSASRRLGTKVLELRDVAKAWDEKQVINGFSYRLSRGERIGIIGPNGSGKSTLLDMIAGKTLPDSGSLELGETVSIAYFDQHVDDINPALEVLEYVSQAAERVRLNDGQELAAEQFLERFGFPRSMHREDLGRLSGGELRRLALLRLLMSNPNVLLLDEPTNDFDVRTIAMLEEFLAGFSGCVLAVSHDRAFLENLSDSLWILDGKGAVRSFSGSWSTWLELKAAEEAKEELAVRAQNNFSSSAASENRRVQDSSKNKGLGFREQREFDELLPRIDTLEARKQELELLFADSEAAKDAQAFSSANTEYAEVLRLIDELTSRWEELAARC